MYVRVCVRAVCARGGFCDLNAWRLEGSSVFGEDTHIKRVVVMRTSREAEK